MGNGQHQPPHTQDPTKNFCVHRCLQLAWPATPVAVSREVSHKRTCAKLPQRRDTHLQTLMDYLG
ncbi:hypothetical protein Cenrod_0903 [Candidatus Symbiobacter mobilis CR]|uniref:Uncharacterized protein n=1 Tax=Candidatus Symbiobacter mobilis CR TaxID=946483 RepID=U5N665_9BURK|nr:hypothetical protein Cenrod_0903 [Candidatus Symbiobacter mobilis CR]